MRWDGWPSQRLGGQIVCQSLMISAITVWTNTECGPESSTHCSLQTKIKTQLGASSPIRQHICNHTDNYRNRFYGTICCLLPLVTYYDLKVREWESQSMNATQCETQLCLLFFLRHASYLPIKTTTHIGSCYLQYVSWFVWRLQHVAPVRPSVSSFSIKWNDLKTFRKKNRTPTCGEYVWLTDNGDRIHQTTPYIFKVQIWCHNNIDGYACDTSGLGLGQQQWALHCKTGSIGTLRHMPPPLQLF